MIEKILPNIYKIEIPLPRNPLKALNAFVIKGPDRNLVIDTGWNQKECLDAMQNGLREIEVDLKNTEFFITHLHADHIGLVSELTTDSSVIYFNRVEVSKIRTEDFFERLIKFGGEHGFSENEIRPGLENHPGAKYGPGRKLNFTFLEEGDTIRVGEYQFVCVETPGHTWGHMCLFEPDKRILVAGDHILNKITPNIQLWSDDWNPLKCYLENLDKIGKYSVDLVLPGHRRVFTNCRERIEELKTHHRQRCDEVLSILKTGKKNAYKVASGMTWDIDYGDHSWDLFPFQQKWFAMGEAVAHLKYLEEEGSIKRGMVGKQVLFSLNEN